MRLPTLGFRLLSASGIVEATKPSLDLLAAQTGELVRMTVAESGQLTWVARAQGARTRLRFDPETGREVSLTGTASARVWLATLPEKRALGLIQAAGFGKAGERGPNAARSLAEMARRLRAAREDGFSIAIDEAEFGMSAVAVCIQHPQDASIALGTVSVAGPSLRMDRTRLQSFVADLRATAQDLSLAWPEQSLRLFGHATTNIQHT